MWKARDPRLNRDVAIKVSAQQFTDSFSERFVRQARAIAALCSAVAPTDAKHSCGIKLGEERKMKQAWFRRFGWFHFPASVPGAVVFLVAAGFCVNACIAIDRHSHSVSDTLYGVFPFFVCTFLLVDWIARSTSRP